MQQAIEEVAPVIDENHDDRLANANAIFFLNVIYIEIGGIGYEPDRKFLCSK